MIVSGKKWSWGLKNRENERAKREREELFCIICFLFFFFIFLFWEAWNGHIEVRQRWGEENLVDQIERRSLWHLCLPFLICRRWSESQRLARIKNLLSRGWSVQISHIYLGLIAYLGEALSFEAPASISRMLLHGNSETISKAALNLILAMEIPSTQYQNLTEFWLDFGAALLRVAMPFFFFKFII